MKVLQVLNHFLPQQTAGTEVYTWALSKQLQQKNIDVEIVIPNYGKKESASYEYDAIPVFQFAEPSVVDRSLIMGFREPDGLNYFIHYLKERKPEIVHFHELAGSNGITLQHVKAARLFGSKVVVTFHLAGYTCKTGSLQYKDELLCDGKIETRKCSSCYLNQKGSNLLNSVLLPVSSFLFHVGLDTTLWNNKIGTALGTVNIIEQHKKNFESLIQQCDKVVVIAKWYKRILLLNGVPIEKICFIPQALPTAIISSNFIRNNVKAYPIKLLFLGRISPFKGLHLLIEALRELESAKFELHIYGNSDDEAYESNWRNQTKFQSNIIWKGRLAQADVVKTMHEYDALCLCSTFSEMSPLVIQEAFAAGIPVIASNVYGNAELIEDDFNGLLFSFKDVQSLKLVLIRCMNNLGLLPRLRDGIIKPRSFDEIASEYVDLYNQVLET